MTQRDFDNYLDGGALPDDPENRELARLFAEVEELQDADPGPAYWHHFESRMKTRLMEMPRHPKRIRRMGLWAGLAAAAVLLMVLLPRVGGPAAAPRLDQLSAADLALLDAAFPAPVGALPNIDLAEGGLDILLDSLNESDTELYDDIIDVDPDELMSLWEREG